MTRCPTCRAYVWRDVHRCPPAWWCWIPAWDTDPESGARIYAANAASAAEACLARDPEFTDGSVVVMVRPVDGGPVRAFRVVAEVITDYTAEEIELGEQVSA